MEILNKGNIKEFYHFENPIGEGINQVVSGVSLKSGEEVAIKMISLNDATEEDMEYLFKEIQILSEVDHPNIVKLIEVFEVAEEKMFYVVSELAKGGSLAEKIGQRDYFDEATAAQILSPLVDAVSYLHSVGISHRDLKVSFWRFLSVFLWGTSGPFFGF